MAGTRKKIVILSVFIIRLVLCTSTLYAQKASRVTDSLIEKIHWYGLKKTSSVLFAHFDKTVYVNNENVWFTAYLLNYDKSTNDPSILSVLLVNDVDKSIALERQFVMADGLSFGNVLIPDSISPGDYSFIIYTNELVNGKPRDVFTQAVTIKSTSQRDVLASLSLANSVKLPSDGFRRVLFKASTKDGKPMPGAKVIYHIGDSQHPTLSGIIKTDKDGQYLFLIPVSQITEGNNIFEAHIDINNDASDLTLVLPVNKNKFDIKFYPEGGSLVHATQSMIGWEAKTVDGRPLKVTGLLLKDNHPIDTIETDSYGLGRFKLIPLLGNTYRVRLLGYKKDTAYLLPAILPKGPVISLKNAVLNDSLPIKLVSKFPGKYYLLIHNYKQVFYYFPVDVSAAGKPVLINLKDVPKGLATVTVLDTLQRPVAERIFFAHYEQRTLVNITTDQATYKIRQKIHLNLKLTAPHGEPVKGMVSVACVQSNRTEIKKTNDIESYFYLKHDLGILPERGTYFGESTDDRAFLENVLLVKGWSRYTWQEMIDTKTSDTVVKRNAIIFNGDVRRYGKPLKKPYLILVKTDSSTNILKTDADGHFVLNGNNLVTAEYNKIHLLLGHNDDQFGYSIEIPKPFENSNRWLIDRFQRRNFELLSKSKASFDFWAIKGMEDVINLKEVKITSLKNNDFSQNVNFSLGANECGDYVCVYNILNCLNHFNDLRNRPPKKGEIYYILANMINTQTMLIRSQKAFVDASGDAFGQVMYQGCTSPNGFSGLAINGVNYSKEFYSADYAQYNPPGPEYVSTIYWKNLCFVDSNKETDLSFYSSDLTGAFKIIVQGIGTNDVIYGEKEFDVKINKQ